MSRFNNLEFGEEFDGQLQSRRQSDSQPRLVKDENYYRAQAQTAFENGQFEEALRLYAKVLHACAALRRSVRRWCRPD